MQAYANVATVPERKVSKSTQKGYYQFRACESMKGEDSSSSSWYTVRVMRDQPLELNKGDFVKVTGKLKVDSYLSREGKPTSTLYIIAFEATKISKQIQGTSTPANTIE